MSSNHEYYPQINRLRRWHVKFGNPALGTYGGSIITAHSRKLERSAASGADDLYEPDEDETSTDSFSSCSSLDTLKRNDKICHHGQQEHQWQRQLSSVALAANTPSSRTAVMTNVPPHQVPDGEKEVSMIAPVEFYLMIKKFKIHPLSLFQQEYLTWYDLIVPSLNTSESLLEHQEVRRENFDGPDG